eukprot:COSAG01_NODE_3136_length_6529_cov_6.221617_7_plen_300_part_00
MCRCRRLQVLLRHLTWPPTTTIAAAAPTISSSSSSSSSNVPAAAAAAAAAGPTVSAQPWGVVPGQGEVQLVRLCNSSGVHVAVSSFGCVLQSVLLPTAIGERVDVVLGYDTLAEYVGGKANYNSIVGRCANRIPDGRFELDGHTFHLPPNADTAHLHGGVDGLYSRIFTVEELRTTTEECTAVFAYTSPAGEAGYPGQLDVRFTCRLNESNELTMEYEAATDSATIVNLTNHAYWNLAGHDSGSVMNHSLQLHCSTYTPTAGGEQGAPTGEIRAVDHSPFDMRPASVRRPLCPFDGRFD